MKLLKMCILLLGMGAIAGCSGDVMPPVVQVTGKALFTNSSPVALVRVSFHPVQGGAPAEGVTDEKGVFTLKTSGGKSGISLGKYKVSFSVAGTEKSDLAKSARTMRLIPAKYYDDDSTTLAFDVTEGLSEINLKVELSEGDEG